MFHFIHSLRCNLCFYCFMLITYYTILGISENATDDEIKKAYHRKAFQHHPDRNNNSEESKQKFIKIQQAYNTLSDPFSRYYYDMALSNYRKKETYKPKTQSQTQNINNTTTQKENTPKQNNHRKKGCLVILMPVIVYLVIPWFVIYCFYIFLIDSTESETRRSEVIEVGKIARERIERKKNQESLENIQKNIQKSINNFTESHKIIIEPKNDKSPYHGNHLSTGNKPYKSYFGNGIYDKKLPSYILIKNGSSSEAIVLLYDINSSKVIRHVYIQAGHNYKMKNIPVGIYKMKTYYGNDWNPNKRISAQFPSGGFMSDESFSAPESAKDYFYVEKNYDRDGYTYSIYEVTLYKVHNGNMRTKEISNNDFFRN